VRSFARNAQRLEIKHNRAARLAFPEQSYGVACIGLVGWGFAKR
jgi:hypothetical protein